MKKIVLLSLLCVMFASLQAKATSIYRINEATVEAAFEAARPIALTLSGGPSLLDPMNDQRVMADKNVWIAVVLDFFLGVIAIHRVYLGGTPLLILGYFITFGGIFGLVPLIDFVVLIINNADISRYVGNNKFFMW